MARLAAVLSLVVCGCATVPPAARISPPSPSSIEQRSLSDSGLQQFIQANEPGRTVPPTVWEPATLCLVALYFHPEIDIARARQSAAKAAIVTARARPNPTLGVGTEYAPSDKSAPSPWTVGPSVDIPIETAGKRDLRAARALHLENSATMELGQAAWRVRKNVLSAVLDEYLATNERDLLRQEADARTQMVALLRRRLEVGEASRSAVDSVQAGLASARLSLAAAEGRIHESRATLAGTLGLAPSALADVTVGWPNFDLLPADSALASLEREALLNRFDLRAELARYEAARADLRLEAAQRFPDLRLGPGLTWDQGTNRFVLNLSFGLPLFDRKKGPIAEATARLEEEGARVLAAQGRVLEETGATAARYHAALEEAAVADTALASHRSLERAAEEAFRSGSADRLELAGLRAAGLAAERTRLNALRGARKALIDLESSLQLTLDGSPAPVPPATRRDIPVRRSR